MRAIQILSEEHRALNEVLDALQVVLDCQHRDDCLEADLALEALEWLERFTDGLHQEREEIALLPLMMTHAPEETQSVLAELKIWHRRERDRLEHMRKQMEGAAYGDQSSRDAFAVAARDYIEIQRRHSELEEAQLLPLAMEVLMPKDDEIMLEEFVRIEGHYLGKGELEPVERAHDLVARALRRMLDRQPSMLPDAVMDRAPRPWREPSGLGQELAGNCV